MKCILCGTELPETAKYCMECGAKIAHRCPKCDAAIPADARYCSNCGTKLTEGTRTVVVNEKCVVGNRKLPEGFQSEMGDKPFYCGYYTMLPDDACVGWVYGHIEKFKDAPDFYYNLYYVSPQGKAVFLNAGGRSGIEDMFVYDHAAYWRGYDGCYRAPLDGLGATLVSEEEFADAEEGKLTRPSVI